MKKSKKVGAIVEIKLTITGKYSEYTSHKNPITLEMGKSLAAYLKKQNSPGRLLSFPEGKVIDEW